jgi:hypothetical protein
MPWLHQYIGNPVLTWVLNRLFGLRISDAHSGMRAFTRDAYQRMRLQSTGMEFASELIVNAARAGPSQSCARSVTAGGTCASCCCAAHTGSSSFRDSC